MSDAEHMARSIDLAGKIVSIAEQGLRAFECSIDHYPPEFKAIMWDAVAEIASRRAEAARQAQGK